MKIGIVNNRMSQIVILRHILVSVPDYQVIWTAQNGTAAVNRCRRQTPDLVLMDLSISVTGAVATTHQIMQSSPCAILIMTQSIKKNISGVYEAMGQGALDAIDIPILDNKENGEVSQKLLLKIAKINRIIKNYSSSSQFQESYVMVPTLELVAIGASTGGPKALATILSKLPANFNRAVAIVQHLDDDFSQGFADWLNQQISLPVRLALPGDRLEKGAVLIAGSNDHLCLKPDLTLTYTENPIDYPYRPSVDVFFQSLAKNWKNKGTAILLTGMGKDGAQGLSSLKLQGWHTIAQDKETCIVYGMPKAAIELNAAVQILSPEAIAASLRSVNS